MNQHFLGQHDKEEVEMVTRAHPIVFFGQIITTAVLVIAVPLQYVLLRATFPALLDSAFSPFIWVSNVLYFYALWAFFFLAWSRYWFNISIITTERIIKIDQF